MKQAVLKGKFLIEAVITLVTGLHIGTSSDFTPIGAVESPFVRDHFTKVPIIPGSSLKGKRHGKHSRAIWVVPRLCFK